jgi:hypothetical protein
MELTKREEELLQQLSDKLTEIGIKFKVDKKAYGFKVLAITNPKTKQPMYAGPEIVGGLESWVVDGPGMVDDGVDHSDFNEAIRYIRNAVGK